MEKYHAIFIITKTDNISYVHGNNVF